MGINGLNKLFKKYIPEIKQRKSIEYYRGSKFAIDTSIWLYKYINLSNKNDSHPNMYLINFTNQIINMLNNGILPVFCFDGIPPIEKAPVLEKRFLTKEKIKDKIKECGSEQIDKKKSLENQLIYVSKHHKEQLKELLRLLNVPYIVAEGEAEELCAYLQKKNIIDFTVTEDSDALVFGCSNVLKMTPNMRYVYTQYNLKDILYHLKISYNQFIDICILLGCDYCSSIYRLGPVNSYSIITKYGSIENALDYIQKNYTIPDNFDYEKARWLFLNSKNTIENIPTLGSVEDLSHKELRKYFITLGFTDKYFNLVYKKLTNAYINFHHLHPTDAIL